MSNAIPEMKQVLNAVNTLYSLFSHSPLRLNILRQTEQAVDGMAHKLHSATGSNTLAVI